LFEQLQRLESGALDLSPFISVRLAQQLFRATNHSSKLYGSDVLIGRELLLKILEHDTAREGFNLTHRHDKDFIKVYYILRYIFLKRCYQFFFFLEFGERDERLVPIAVRQSLEEHRVIDWQRGGRSADSISKLCGQFSPTAKQHLHSSFRSRHP